ncbi:MAG: hypothetical protein IT342_13945 [Candidatus Melainabacteria bacterium]|nr:hypothetical protein [Candidatus Melainabacteria bacterium]
MNDRASDAYVVRESSSHRMDASELRASIQNIIATEGVKPQSYMCAADSSSAYLPSMEIAGDNNKVAYQKKVIEAKESQQQQPQSQSLDLEGGIRGLVDRADTNNDNRVSRQEIAARLATKLSQQEAIALKDIYRNFADIDGNNNGLISRSDIQTRQNRERSQQQLDDRLEDFRGAVARNRTAIDRNKDGQLSTQELRTAGQSNSGLSREDRDSINWGRLRR